MSINAGSYSVGNNGLSEDFYLQVARGQIDGHRALTRSGVNPDIDTGAVESLWEQGGLYVFPPAATVMTVSSSSASDTAAGVGARSVIIMGLDANYDEIQEIVALNGQTPVNTVNAFLRINTVTVLTAGASAGAVGTIYVGTGVVTLGVPATVYGLVLSGWNTSQTVAYTVPAGYTAYLVDLLVSSISSAVNQNTQLSIRQRMAGSSVFYRGGSLVVTAGLAHIPFAIPRAFIAKTDIDIVAQTTDNNVVATTSARIMLVSDNLGD